MSQTPASLTEEQLRSGLAIAKTIIERWAPGKLKSAAQVPDLIANNPNALRAATLLGGEGLARMTAAWQASGPGSIVPTVDSRDAVQHGIAEIRGAAASIMKRRDDEIVAFHDLTIALMGAGWDVVMFALPHIIAAIPK